MDVIEAIKERRSVRNFKNEKVDINTMKEIIDLSRWSPSWANFQIARYTIINDDEVIAKIASQGVKGFAYNINTLKKAKGIAVISFVKGKSGKLDETNYATDKNNEWEIFDAGIACQTFCLAAHAKGVGTCIFGVIDDKKIADIINLPAEETVATIIAFGYEDGAHATATPRKSVEELTRFI